MPPLLQRPAYPWRADEATQKPAASSRRVHGRKVRCSARDRDREQSMSKHLQGSKTRSAGRGAHAHVVACMCVGRRATRRPFFRRGRGHRRRARRPGVRGLPESNGSRALAVAPAGGRDVSPFTEGTHVTATGARAAGPANHARKAEPGAAARTPLLLASGSGGSRATRHIIHTDGSVPIQI